MRRFAFLSLPLLAALLAVFLLVHRDEPEQSAGPEADAPETTQTQTPSLLTVEKGEAADTAPRLEGHHAPAADASRDAHGPVTVRVVGPDDQPLTGLLVGRIVEVERSPTKRERVLQELIETDAHGEVDYRDLPYDGSVQVGVWRGRAAEGVGGDGPVRAAGYKRYVPVRGPELRYRAFAGHRLDVRIVEALTGRRVPAARVEVTGKAGDRVFLQPGRKEKLAMVVSPPRGWIAWDATTWNVQVSPFARRLVAVVPLRQEVPLVLGILEPDGTPVARPVVTRVKLAGRTLSSDRIRGDAFGRMQLGGVPFLPGELVKVSARRKGGHAQGTTQARIPDDPREAFTAEIVVPVETPLNMIGIGGHAGGSFGVRYGHRNLDGIRLLQRTERGSVLVQVLRHGGRVAPWADVWLGGRHATTDRNGRAFFDAVLPGKYAVRAKAVGLFALSSKVQVRPKKTAHVKLEEGLGADLEVQVVDEQGRGLSFATLEVRMTSHEPWVDLDAKGVQRLDPFTDEEGRRVLRHLQPGKVTLKATWGSRTTRATVLLTEGREPQAIKLMLPRSSTPAVQGPVRK